MPTVLAKLWAVPQQWLRYLFGPAGLHCASVLLLAMLIGALAFALGVEVAEAPGSA